MTSWNFEHTIHTKATRKAAWNFLSDMSNQTRMEEGVENIELDGPFESGTQGRTITKTYTQEWELRNVIAQEEFTIQGITDEDGVTVSFTWKFAEEGEQTRLTQRIEAVGTHVDRYKDIFQGMENHVPIRMAELANVLDQLATSNT